MNTSQSNHIRHVNWFAPSVSYAVVNGAATAKAIAQRSQSYRTCNSYIYQGTELLTFLLRLGYCIQFCATLLYN